MGKADFGPPHRRRRHQRRLQPVRLLRRRPLELRPVHRPTSSRGRFPGDRALSRLPAGGQRRRLRLPRHDPCARPQQPVDRRDLAREGLGAERPGGTGDRPFGPRLGLSDHRRALAGRLRRAEPARRRESTGRISHGEEVSDAGDYILGVIGLVAVVLSMAIAGRTARRAALPGWTGTPALLADAVLAIGILVLVAEILGLLGLLEGVLLVAAALIVGGGALRLEPMLIRAGARVAHWGKAYEPDLRRAPPVGRIELGAAIVLALIVAAQWAGPTLLALDRGIYGGDSLWYHLPLAAHIAESGSVTGLLYTDPLYLNWFYPQVSELLHAGGILLISNDFLSPLMNMAWLGLALFAGYCIGRPYGTGPIGLAAVASVMAANLLFSRQPGNANNDVVAIALFLSSVALLLNVRWPERPGTPGIPSSGPPAGILMVAGLAAGLALGTKLTVVPPVLALTVGVIWISGAGYRLRASAEWIGAMVVGGGYWYVRNLIVSGNPFPWQDIGPIHHAEALGGRHPYSIAHYATDTDVWGRYFTPALHERLGDLWPAYLALAVIAVGLVLWRGGAVEWTLGGASALAAVAYLLTPLGASGPEGAPIGFPLNIRYPAPGLVLALTPLAIPPSFAGRQRMWRLGTRERLWRFCTLAIFAVLILVSSGA